MDDALRTILSYTMEAAAPILAALLAALLLKALRWAGVKVTEAQEAKWDGLAAKAMEYAEQMARKRLKIGEPSASGAERMDAAMKYALEIAGDKLPGDFQARIEAQLGAVNRYKDAR
jgi:hypothetical protein